MLVRGDNFSRAKARNQERIGQAGADGKVRIHFNSQPLQIGADFIEFAASGTTRRQKNDAIFIMIGGELPFDLLENIGVKIIEKEI